MAEKCIMATATAIAPALPCLLLAGCAGPINLMQQSIYHDDTRIARGFDTYTVANRNGSLPDRHLGEFSGLETWLRLSIPEKGGTFRIDYDVDVSAGDFKIVLVDGEDVDVVCEGTAVGSRIFTLDPGDYALKAVGVHANVDIELELQASEDIDAVEPDGPLGDDKPAKLQPLES